MKLEQTTPEPKVLTLRQDLRSARQLFGPTILTREILSSSPPSNPAHSTSTSQSPHSSHSTHSRTPSPSTTQTRVVRWDPRTTCR